jgi:hypothetical protein
MQHCSCCLVRSFLTTSNNTKRPIKQGVGPAQ